MRAQFSVTLKLQKDRSRPTSRAIGTDTGQQTSFDILSAIEWARPALFLLWQGRLGFAEAHTRARGADGETVAGWPDLRLGEPIG